MDTGALVERGSLRNNGAHWSAGSLTRGGALAIDGSLTRGGALRVIGSLSMRGALGSCGSLKRDGALRVAGLGCQGTSHPAVTVLGGVGGWVGHDGTVGIIDAFRLAPVESAPARETPAPARTRNASLTTKPAHDQTVSN